MIVPIVIAISVIVLIFFKKWKVLAILFAIFILHLGVLYQTHPFFEGSYMMTNVTWRTWGSILEILSYLTIIITFIKNEHKKD